MRNSLGLPNPGSVTIRKANTREYTRALRWTGDGWPSWSLFTCVHRFHTATPAAPSCSPISDTVFFRLHLCMVRICFSRPSTRACRREGSFRSGSVACVSRARAWHVSMDHNGKTRRRAGKYIGSHRNASPFLWSCQGRYFHCWPAAPCCNTLTETCSSVLQRVEAVVTRRLRAGDRHAPRTKEQFNTKKRADGRCGRSRIAEVKLSPRLNGCCTARRTEEFQLDWHRTKSPFICACR